MLVIFAFSNESGNKSADKSNKITESVIKITNNNDVENTRFIVRKTAHFILYFILGTLIYLTLRSYNIEKNIILYSILFAFIYAISDEIHQVFTPDRTFKIYDICIDTIASSISIILLKRKEF